MARQAETSIDLSEADRLLYAGLMRLHILRRAEREATLAAAFGADLSARGYRIGAGTLYTLLHNLEMQGLLASETRLEGRERKRAYRATEAGRKALREAAGRVDGLMKELAAGAA